MTIHLYRCSADNRVVDKSNYLSDLVTLNCEMVNTDILDPTIKLSSNYLTYNYAYIPSFNRWYFVRGDDTIEGTHILKFCHVDVLMSYKDDIKNLECYITRQENTYNKNIPDNYMIGQIKKQEEQRVLPTIFEYEPNDNYLLITV